MNYRVVNDLDYSLNSPEYPSHRRSGSRSGPVRFPGHNRVRAGSNIFPGRDKEVLSQYPPNCLDHNPVILIAAGHSLIYLTGSFPDPGSIF